MNFPHFVLSCVGNEKVMALSLKALLLLLAGDDEQSDVYFRAVAAL